MTLGFLHSLVSWTHGAWSRTTVGRHGVSHKVCKLQLDINDLHAFMRFLDEHILREGDYLVVEDTVDEAKRNELGEFLAGTPEGRYAVDTHLTDYFGENVCWNVNAYLRRMK